MNEKVNRIISHPVFLSELKVCREWEQKRIFCGHDIDHLLSVARFAWIYILENQLAIPIELVYGAALLHDIGRAQEYAGGPAHDISGCQLAEVILTDCGYEEAEKSCILAAIGSHRQQQESNPQDLKGILYLADKRTRPCFACQAEEMCDWDEAKKNREIIR